MKASRTSIENEPLLRRVVEEVAAGTAESAARLVGEVRQLLDENAGFADEVLRSYEQLSLIFDITQQITQGGGHARDRAAGATPAGAARGRG